MIHMVLGNVEMSFGVDGRMIVGGFRRVVVVRIEGRPRCEYVGSIGLLGKTDTFPRSRAFIVEESD